VKGMIWRGSGTHKRIWRQLGLNYKEGESWESKRVRELLCYPICNLTKTKDWNNEGWI